MNLDFTLANWGLRAIRLLASTAAGSFTSQPASSARLKEKIGSSTPLIGARAPSWLRSLAEVEAQPVFRHGNRRTQAGSLACCGRATPRTRSSRRKDPEPLNSISYTATIFRWWLAALG